MFTHTASVRKLGRMSSLFFALSLSMVLAPGARAADEFPTRAITIIVPAAFGATTLQIQVLAPCLSNLLGKQVIVENRPGAGGGIGTTAVKNAKADGYTLLFAATAVLSIVPHLSPMTYGLQDFVPIGNVTGVPMLMVARATAPYQTFEEFMAYAKANPKLVNFASGGHGTSMHMTGEELQVVTGVDFTHIPFQGGGPAIQGLLSNSADIVIAPPSLSKPTVDSGRLRTLALFSEARHPSLPDVPTAREKGVEVIETLKSGLLAPAGIPVEAQLKLVEALATAMNNQQCVDQLLKKNFDPLYLPPAAFGQALQTEISRYDKLFSNAKFAERVK